MNNFIVQYAPTGPLPSTTPLRLPLAFLPTPSRALLFLGIPVGYMVINIWSSLSHMPSEGDTANKNFKEHE